MTYYYYYRSREGQISIKVAWAVDLLYNIQRRLMCDEHKHVDAHVLITSPTPTTARQQARQRVSSGHVRFHAFVVDLLYNKSKTNEEMEFGLKQTFNARSKA